MSDSINCAVYIYIINSCKRFFENRINLDATECDAVLCRFYALMSLNVELNGF